MALYSYMSISIGHIISSVRNGLSEKRLVSSDLNVLLEKILRYGTIIQGIHSLITTALAASLENCRNGVSW